MVAAPEDHRWSSYHANALGEINALILPHPTYTALATTSDERQQAYRADVLPANPKIPPTSINEPDPYFAV
jgi:hypothetical protein